MLTSDDEVRLAIAKSATYHRSVYLQVRKNPTHKKAKSPIGHIAFSHLLQKHKEIA